jgi:two-component system NtrC family sensor kinase
MAEEQQSARILIVEDDPDMMDLLRHLLVAAHYQALLADSGKKALALLRAEAEADSEIDLVLLDIMMPHMNGYEVIAHIRADPLLQYTPVIMTTALDSVRNKALGLELGANDYLTKPFEPRELLARIDAALRIRRSEQALRQRNRELAALIELNRTVTATLDLDQVIEATMRGISGILQVEAACLVLIEEDSEELTVRGVLGQNGDDIKGRVLDPAGAVVGEVVDTGRPWLSNGSQLDAPFLPGPGREWDIWSWATLCVPLIMRNRVTGAIEVAGRPNTTFDRRDLELLQAVAATVAAAVDNATLYAEQSDFIQALERSQAQLVQAEKMAAVGRLAASIAHEINNPLQAIHNSLHLCAHRGLGEREHAEYLGLAQDEVQRLIEIVQRMLDFYRPSHGGMILDSVNDIIDNALMIARKPLHDSHVEVCSDLSLNLPSVRLVRDQMTQVFLNIVINAIEAMPGGGELSVRTALADDGQWVLASFRDGGSGLSAEQMDHLFEPFYTTKPGGTGLGLAISYEIVKRHDGTIDVETQAGRSATFTVKLPVPQRGA